MQRQKCWLQSAIMPNTSSVARYWTELKFPTSARSETYIGAAWTAGGRSADPGSFFGDSVVFTCWCRAVFPATSTAEVFLPYSSRTTRSFGFSNTTYTQPVLYTFTNTLLWHLSRRDHDVLDTDNEWIIQNMITVYLYYIPILSQSDINTQKVIPSSSCKWGQI